MEPYSKEVETRYKLSLGDSWLRKRQGLALPVLPPTTPEAQKIIFFQIFESLLPSPVSLGKARLTLKHLLRNGTNPQMVKIGFMSQQKCCLHTQKPGRSAPIFEHHKNSSQTS